MKFWKKAFGVFISVLFLWMALRNVDWAKIPAILATVRLEFVLVMILSSSIEYLTRGIRWRGILGKNGFPLLPFVSGWILGALCNNIFPARAGEFVRSFYLGRKNLIPTSEAFGSIVLERFLDGLVVMSFIAVSFTFFPVHEHLRKAGYSAAVFYAVVFCFIIMMQFKKAWFDALLSFFVKPLPESWRTKILSAQDSFVKGFALVRQPQNFILMLLFSFLTWGFSIFTIRLLFLVFSLAMGFKEALLLVSILSIGAMIPSSPGMIGIYEYCCVLALSDVLGLPKELAITVGFFNHSFGYFFILLLGGGFMFFENISLQELRKEVPENGNQS